MAAPTTQAQAVDMLSSIVAQLTAGQRQQNNTSTVWVGNGLR